METISGLVNEVSGETKDNLAGACERVSQIESVLKDHGLLDRPDIKRVVAGLQDSVESSAASKLGNDSAEDFIRKEAWTAGIMGILLANVPDSDDRRADILDWMKRDVEVSRPQERAKVSVRTHNGFAL